MKMVMFNSYVKSREGTPCMMMMAMNDQRRFGVYILSILVSVRPRVRFFLSGCSWIRDCLDDLGKPLTN